MRPCPAPALGVDGLGAIAPTWGRGRPGSGGLGALVTVAAVKRAEVAGAARAPHVGRARVARFGRAVPNPRYRGRRVWQRWCTFDLSRSSPCREEEW